MKSTLVLYLITCAATTVALSATPVLAKDVEGVTERVIRLVPAQ